MSLPAQIGDKLAFHEETVDMAPKALMDAAEKIEAVVSVLLRSHPDNPAGSIIFLGDDINQPWPLAVGEAFGIAVSRRSAVHVRGDRDGLRLIVGAVLTTGKVPTARIGLGG